MSSVARVWALVALAACASRKDTPTRDAKPAAVEPADAPAGAVAAERPLELGALPWRPRPTIQQMHVADELLADGDARAALAALGKGSSPPAQLLRARAHRMLGERERVAPALERASADTALASHVALERGLHALDTEDGVAAASALVPLLAGEDRSVARRAALPALRALAYQPAELLRQAAAIEKVLPPDDIDARSIWLAAQADAATALGDSERARALAVRRYLEEPVSLLTPEDPPEGAAPTAVQLLERAEVLLEEHRNERVLEAVGRIPAKELDAEQLCRLHFAHGLAARKLRRYTEAETHLGKVTASCKDDELVRRAMYLQAKVVSIKSGLSAIPIIEKFAERFKGETMVDDTLFWAGDMFQRRKRYEEAAAWYDRIIALPEKGDYCAEAAWRNAWMSYRRNQLDDAATRLEKILADAACTPERFERARAAYWRGRIFVHEKDSAAAVRSFEQARAFDPLGYYGQLALTRLDEIAPSEERRWALPPKKGARPDLCPGFLADDHGFTRGLELMVRGLLSDAAEELRAIELPEQEVMGATHAASLGVAAKPAESKTASLEPCGPNAPYLLLALLLDETRAYREAHWRLRTDFKDLLASEPTEQTAAIWLAAYPLAFREQIEPAEKESGLPNMFLQALAREESALDPEVVSWAGAYGLTQLLLSSGQRAGKLLSPPVVVERAEELLEPQLNARLGGALLASEVKKLGDNLALALAAYNAGDHVAVAWWKRHQGEPFDVFAEEMTIKETRGYVKRVLRTFGIYRWLYAGQPPVLPIETVIPRR